MKEFRSGAMNSWPMVIPAWLLNLSGNLSYGNLIIVGRLLLPIGVASLTIFPLYKIMKHLQVSTHNTYIAIAFFAISPVVISQAEMWYPDSYVMFVSALFILEFLKARESTTKLVFRNQKLMLIFAVGVSVKHNFAFFFALLIIYEFLSRNHSKFGVRQKMRLVRKVFSDSKYFVFSSALVFIAINYSVLFDFLNFLRALNGNRKIYAITDLNFVPGFLFYFYNLMISPIGLIGFVVLVSGVITLVRADRKLAFSFLIFLILFLLLAAFPKQALARNINLLLPFTFIFMGLGLDALQKNKRRWIYALIVCLMVLSVGKSQMDFQPRQLKQDSYTATQAWISKNLIGEIVGVNNGCNGPSPAFIGGASVRNVIDTSGDLNYYLFSSFGSSPFSGYFRQQNVYISGSPRYLLSYSFNDTRIFHGWSDNASLEDFTPQGYKVKRVFSGSGPTFVLLEKIEKIR